MLVVGFENALWLTQNYLNWQFGLNKDQWFLVETLLYILQIFLDISIHDWLRKNNGFSTVSSSKPDCHTFKVPARPIYAISRARKFRALRLSVKELVDSEKGKE